MFSCVNVGMGCNNAKVLRFMFPFLEVEVDGEVSLRFGIEHFESSKPFTYRFPIELHVAYKFYKPVCRFQKK